MYEWISSTLGVGDGVARAASFVVSLGVVLALVALFFFILKKLTGARINTTRGRQPRIAIMDAASIDTRRRLVLVRRDNIEHLILIGGPTDVVVEQGIIRGQPLGANMPRPLPGAQAPGPGALEADVTPVPPAPPAPVAQPVPTTQQPAAAAVQTAPSPKAPSAQPVGPAQSRFGTDTPPTGTAPAEASARPTPPSHVAAKTDPAGLFEPEPEQSQSSSAKVNAGSLIRAAAKNALGAAASVRDRTATKTPPEPQVKAAAKPTAASDDGKGADLNVAPAPIAAPAPDVKGPAPAPSERKSFVSGFADSITKPLANRMQPSSDKPRSVSPPSSGPAARARTALFRSAAAEKQEPAAPAVKALGAEAGNARTKPVEPAASPLEPTALASQVPQKPAPDPHVLSGSPSQCDSVAQSDSAAKPDEPPKTPVDTNNGEKTSESQQPEKPEQDQPALAAMGTEQDMQNQIQAQTTVSTGASLVTHSPQEEATTDKLASGLEASLSTPVVEDKPASESTPVIKAVTTEPAPSGSKAPHVPPPVKKSPLDDKNPLEDEMAKILDEIHGSAKS
ncbi:flagellar biosynthesis protein FliO [Roseibium hamelinense]|uniref:Flagellar biosynthesis protein FliO n=1 Tax=Roseibium hamelinense TaxID=150831 RepID=A0A562T9X0_9HYPH|nr:flagellar biosynthetic protein FliO [Roseibium hamelinense]TWI90395.1 flagellar biosynthesis protein FliO [Roseibium hamelinense]